MVGREREYNLDYLHYAYEPRESIQTLSDSIIKAAEKNPIESATNNSCHSAFISALNSCYQKTPENVTHIVPLSSGLDSRAILCGLLNELEVDPVNIHTVTFGYPGSYNYEYAAQVANYHNVKNYRLNTLNIAWNIDGVRQTIENLPYRNKAFNGHIIRSALSQLVAENSVIWSGFFGDPSIGSHLPQSPAETWQEAKEKFSREKQKTAVSLTPDDYDPIECLPETPFVSQSQISYEEQLDYAVRQRCFIRPLVNPSDLEFVTPYCEPEWLDFALNIENKHRHDRRIFKQMCLQAYPDSFSISTDAHFGLPLGTPRWKRILIQRIVRPSIRKMRSGSRRTRTPNSGFDYAYELRHNDTFKPLIYEQLMKLRDRDMFPWIDIQKLWEEHQSGEADRESELRILAIYNLFERSK